MKGARHYYEAELLLNEASQIRYGDPDALVRRAQVHATLAQAAATAMGNTGHPVDRDVAAAWHEVTQ